MTTPKIKVSAQNPHAVLPTVMHEESLQQLFAKDLKICSAWSI
jgi:hypothetical protein